MGSCLSKKNTSSASTVPLPKPPPEKPKSGENKKACVEEENVVKKEVFIIKHRKSHEVERQRSDDEKGEAKKPEEFVEKGKNVVGSAPVRTSSCTKEEVDAILIQCGRLSRSSSTGKAALSAENGGRKYSGSKRSYDFDNENGRSDGNNVVDGDDDVVARERENRRRERNRHQSQGRRRTPSRERDRDQQQRSGSRERGSGGGRRVSRSPGRRSESPITTSGANSNPNSSAAANANSKPGKMVSVPATVSSLAMDKSGGGGEGNPTGAVKRIQVKRNVGGDGSRTGASPRARSPARVRGINENTQQQPLSLSRSNSRKAEHSPYRRNPLAEIDSNIISQKTTAENKTSTIKQDSNPTNLNPKTQEQQQQQQQPNHATETKTGPYGITNHVALNVITSGPDNLKPPNAVARSRSSRLSRDLDINPETLSNPPQSSYTALLLEDIQNFHQKNTQPSFTLPPCVTKACSILDAVADLNSSTGSALSATFSEDRRRNPITDQMSKMTEKPSSATIGKTKPEIREPVLESEVVVNDDLMEPSFHKYVTVTRGTSGGSELEEEEESSGSNSYAGSHQQWLSSSSWEPNSADSTDRWASSSSSSRTGTRHNESGRGVDEGGKRLSAKKRDFDHQQNGNGRGRIGSRGSHMVAHAST